MRLAENLSLAILPPIFLTPPISPLRAGVFFRIFMENDNECTNECTKEDACILAVAAGVVLIVVVALFNLFNLVWEITECLR